MRTLTLDKSAMHNHQHTEVSSELNAALHAKCPKCRTGNMFANNLYSLSGQKMNEYCPHCDFYALNVALLVTLAVGTYILTHSENPWLYSVMLLLPACLLSPFTFRYSRVILLYWLTPGVHFKPERANPDYKYPTLK
jgi:uncharacterized protein (DUF983 family)